MSGGITWFVAKSPFRLDPEPFNPCVSEAPTNDRLSGRISVYAGGKGPMKKQPYRIECLPTVRIYTGKLTGR